MITDVDSGAIPAPPAPVPALSARARLAVLWETGFSAFRDLLQFGLTFTLARLLPAEVYGQFGFLTTTLTFLTLFSFREFLNFTLLVREDRDVAYQEHFSAGLLIQSIVFVIANLTAVGLRWSPKYAPVSPVLHVMSVLFLLDLPGELRVKMLERDLDWRRLRTLHGIGLLGNAVLSLVMAWMGFGVYALLVPTLFVSVPFAIDLFWGARFRPTFRFNWARYRAAWRFGWSRISAATFGQAAQMLESAQMVLAIGFAPLGIYTRAVSVASLACDRFTSLLTTSLYPVLAKVEPGSATYRKASGLLLQTVFWTTIPSAVVLSVIAHAVVRVLYGTQWFAAVPLLPFALVMNVTLAMSQTVYTLALASHGQRTCLVTDAWRLGGTAVALFVVLPYGASWYLASQTAVFVVSFVVLAGWLVHRRNLTVGSIGEAAVPAIVSTAIAWGVCQGVWRVAGLDVASIWLSALYGVLFTVIYVAVLRMAFGDRLRACLEYFPKRHHWHRVFRFPAAA
jgi:O-antigen/teichoic acid export membrane protein